MVNRLIDYEHEDEWIQENINHDLRDNYLKYIPGTK